MQTFGEIISINLSVLNDAMSLFDLSITFSNETIGFLSHCDNELKNVQSWFIDLKPQKNWLFFICFC